MTLKEDLHRLVDELSERDLVIVRRFLEDLAVVGRAGGKDGLVTFLAACPEDDEPTEEEDLTAAVSGREDAVHGKLVPHQVVIDRTRGRDS